jgi:hypothetical protein
MLPYSCYQHVDSLVHQCSPSNSKILIYIHYMATLTLENSTSANLIERWTHDTNLAAVIFVLRLLSDIVITGVVCAILLRKRKKAYRE